MTIEARKYQLIKQIMGISDEAFLGQVEKMIEEYLEGSRAVAHLVRPMREKLDVQQLVKEQGFEGADKEVIDHLIEEAAIEEPIEALLEMLSK